MIRHTEFYSTLKHAYGGEQPSYGCLFLETAGDRHIYECWLIDWDITVSVPLPRNCTFIHGVLGTQQENPHDPKGRKLRFVDILAYMLAKYDKMSPKIQEHLRGRFGPMLKTMQQQAEEIWKINERTGPETWKTELPHGW